MVVIAHRRSARRQHHCHFESDPESERAAAELGTASSRGGLPVCSAESVRFGLPRTDENSPGIPDQEGEGQPHCRNSDSRKMLSMQILKLKLGRGRLEVPEAQMQKSEARIAGHLRWLESTAVSAYVTVHIDSCRRSLCENPT